MSQFFKFSNIRFSLWKRRKKAPIVIDCPKLFFCHSWKVEKLSFQVVSWFQKENQHFRPSWLITPSSESFSLPHVCHSGGMKLLGTYNISLVVVVCKEITSWVEKFVNFPTSVGWLATSWISTWPHRLALGFSFSIKTLLLLSFNSPWSSTWERN